MGNTFLIVIGLAFLVILIVGVGTSLDTERQRTARRELASQRRLRHEQRVGQRVATGQWDDDDWNDHD